MSVIIEEKDLLLYTANTVNGQKVRDHNERGERHTHRQYNVE
jgi:hypothetical protein